MKSALVGLLAVFLAGCGGAAVPAGGANTPTPSKPTKTESLTVAITSQGMDVIPLFIADKQGFLSREGLQVERSIVSAGATIATGVLSSSINVGYANASPILSGSTAGNVAILATPSVHYPYSLL
ncbi:MAG: hypothetical protein ACHQ7M_00865, partial [Chloroflexota bacterium]